MGARRLPVGRLVPAPRETRKRPAQHADVLPPQAERQFQDAVLDVAKRLGWRCYHTWNSMHSTGGFPDLVLVRRPRVIFAELKSELHQATQAQLEWLLELGASGAEAYCWRPSDWDAITRILR